MEEPPTGAISHMTILTAPEYVPKGADLMRSPGLVRQYQALDKDAKTDLLGDEVKIGRGSTHGGTGVLECVPLHGNIPGGSDWNSCTVSDEAVRQP